MSYSAYYHLKIRMKKKRTTNEKQHVVVKLKDMEADVHLSMSAHPLFYRIGLSAINRLISSWNGSNPSWHPVKGVASL